MDEGNFFAYPNNRIIWYDKAWTYNRIQSNPGYIIDSEIYSVEGSAKLESTHEYMTNFNEVK
jgi:hypothetical protein